MPLFLNASRTVLIVTLIGAPWWFGGVTSAAQVCLYAGVMLSLVLWLLSLLAMPRYRLGREFEPKWPPFAVLLAGLALLLAAVQLAPLPLGPAHFAHAELAQWFSTVELPVGQWRPASLYPAATRLELFRLLFAVTVLFLSSQLFLTPQSRTSLLAAVALNGTALALFGFVQKLNWNGMLYWRIPLTQGGQPFASYVNRNNAAGYLCLCLACACGLAFGLYQKHRNSAHGVPSRVKPSPRTTRGRAPQPHDENDLVYLWTMVVVAMLLALGVLATASRGGFLALVGTMVVLIVMIGMKVSGRAAMFGTVAAIALAIGGLIWLGLGTSVKARLDTLRDIERITDSRPQHWADTIRAVADFPVLGTGLGTYRYAHRPYQSHRSIVTYFNADNEYVEWIVEGGLVGIAIVLAFAVHLLFVSRRLLARKYGPAAIDVGTMLLLGLVGQATLAVTDFGISLPANMLLAAAIVGMATGHATTRLKRKNWGELPERPRQHRGTSNLALIGVVLLLEGGVGLWGIWNEAQTDRFLATLPDLLTPSEESDLDVEIALLRETELPRSFGTNDHALLHRSLAWLHIYRMRRQIAATLTDSVDQKTRVDKKTQARVWRSTHPTALFTILEQQRQQGDRVELDSLLPEQAQRDYRLAMWHLQLAERSCPLLPGLSVTLGCISSDSPSRKGLARSMFRRATFLSPTDVDTLKRVARLSQLAGDDDFAEYCEKRAGAFAP